MKPTLSLASISNRKLFSEPPLHRHLQHNQHVWIVFGFSPLIADFVIVECNHVSVSVATQRPCEPLIESHGLNNGCMFTHFT